MATQANMDALLSAFMSPDNAVRSKAEAAWEDMKRQVPDQVLENLCGVLVRQDAQSEGLRAMAAVLMRTLFDVRSDLWFRVQPQTKSGVKAALLSRLTEEPVAHIRRKLTHAVGQLAGISISEAEWPEVMALTVALCSATQQTPELKIVGLDLVNILSEFCLESLSPHKDGVLQMFDAFLEDPSIGVRVAAMKAACSFLQDAVGSGDDSEGSSARSARVHKMMAVLEATINAGNEDAARDVLEALNEMAAKQPRVLIAGMGLDITGQAMLSLATNPALEVATRELSLEFLTALCESAPYAMQDRGIQIIQKIVPLTIHMLAQQEDKGDQDLTVWVSSTDGVRGEDDDGDEDELGMVAASTLSRVAIALGGKIVMSSALPVCSEFLADASDWRRRKAGLITLLLIGEGCGEDMAKSGLLPQIVLGPVLAGIGDAHPRVRYAALACLGQMAEDFSDWDGGGDEDDDAGGMEGGESFIGVFHSQLLPPLVQSLGVANANMPRLQAAAAGALITFCNPARMQAEWLYAPAPAGLEGGGGGAIGKVLLEGLCVLVRGSPSVVVREEALTAVGCVAQVLGPGFGSFYGTFVPLAKEILSSTPPVDDTPPDARVSGGGGVSDGSGAGPQNTDILRGKAMEAIALMGQAVGLEIFRADAHQVIKVLLSEQKTVSRDPGNPQSTYTLQSLARMAGVLREEFLPYLADAVTPLLAALSMDAEIKVSTAAESNMANAKEEMEAAGLTPLEMDLRGIGRQLFGVNTSLMQAKEIACKTLYQYTEDLGDSFAEHAAGTLAVVLPNLGPRNAVAVQVVSAAIVPRLVGMASRLATSRPALLPQAQGMLDAAVSALCEATSRISGERGRDIETGGDMEPACIAADSLTTLLEDHCKLKDPSPLTVSEESVVAVVTVLRDAAVSSMYRSKTRAEQREGREGSRYPGGMTSAVDSAEEEEQEAWEDDILTSAVDGIGWIIKGWREAFLPMFESMLKPLVLPLLRPDQPPRVMPPSERSFGLCMCIDVLEHCGVGGQRAVFADLLPALMRGCTDEVSSTRQACAYGIGAAAAFGGPEFDGVSAEALNLLLTLAAPQGGGEGNDDDDEEEEDVDSIVDNAVSAALRLIFARLGPIMASITGGDRPTDPSTALAQEQHHLGPMVNSLLGKLPLTMDISEGHDCHRRILDLACAGHPLLIGGDQGQNVPQLLSAIAGMMVYQPSEYDEEAAVSAGGDGGQGGGSFGSSCGRMEKEEAMWARQYLGDREARKKAEQAVTALKGAFPSVVERAWAGLEEEERRALQTPTANICPQGCKGCNGRVVAR